MRSSTGATQVLPRRDETFLHNPSLVKKYFFCRRATAVWAFCDVDSARLGHLGPLCPAWTPWATPRLVRPVCPPCRGASAVTDASWPTAVAPLVSRPPGSRGRFGRILRGGGRLLRLAVSLRPQWVPARPGWLLVVHVAGLCASSGSERQVTILYEIGIESVRGATKPKYAWSSTSVAWELPKEPCRLPGKRLRGGVG